MLVEAKIYLNSKLLMRNFEIFKEEKENLNNGSPIALALCKTWLNDKNIPFLQKLPKFRDILFCYDHGWGGGVWSYAREADVKLIQHKTTTVSEFITIKDKRQKSRSPFFVSTSYTNRRNKITSEIELEKYLTGPLLVGINQHFVCGHRNTDLMKANSLS